MAFRVEVSRRAFEDLDGIADYITKHGSFERADKWFDEIIEAIASLKQMPHRCPVADESEELGQGAISCSREASPRGVVARLEED